MRKSMKSLDELCDICNEYCNVTIDGDLFANIDSDLLALNVIIDKRVDIQQFVNLIKHEQLYNQYVADERRLTHEEWIRVRNALLGL